MKSGLKRVLCSSLVLTAWMIPVRSWAWADHYLVTAAAIAPLKESTQKTVRYTEFNTLLKDLGYTSALDFNEQLQIHKEYLFTPKLGEKDGQEFSVHDVLTKYSDEPDWGMDKELFNDDEYPELWKSEYSMMGGKEGTPSQAFRHMYWQKLNILHMLKTFKLPLSKLFQSMGEAPDRARIFVELSRLAKAKGHDYWSVRFLANALHYLEDCSQPFHTTQVPTKEYLFMPIFNKDGDGFKQYVTQMTNIIVYYHYGFEDDVSQLMAQANKGDTTGAGNLFVGNLGSLASGPSKLSYEKHDVAAQVRAMAKIAVQKSAVAGRASLDFFPSIVTDYAKFSADDFMDSQWWAGVVASSAKDSPEKQKYFEVVRSMFEPLGYAVRQVVQAELGARDPASKPSKK
jgi:hypothetical protein